MKSFLSVTALLFLGLTTAACDGKAYDCHTICDRYAECVDSNYDVDNCTDRCIDDAERDEDYAQRADDCQECLDEKACGESVGCLDECIGIVP